MQSLRLQNDKAKTQMKIDNDRRLQAMRDEIKSKLESKYLKLENETRSKSFKELKEMSTVHQEKHKLNCQHEAAQKMKVIQKEYDIIFDKLRSQNETYLKSLNAKEAILSEIKHAKDKVKTKRRELIDMTDQASQDEFQRVKLSNQLNTLKQKFNIEQPTDHVNDLVKKLQKEVKDKDVELVDTHDAMNRLTNMRAMQDSKRPETL